MTICKNCGQKIKKVHVGSGNEKEYRHGIIKGKGLMRRHEWQLRYKGCTNPEPKEDNQNHQKDEIGTKQEVA